MASPIRPHSGMSPSDDWALDTAAYLAAIVESSDFGIIGKDMDGIIRSWNRGAQSIFGYEPADVIGRPIQILFPPDRLDEEDQIMARLRRGERIEHHETVRRRKDGSDLPVSVTISPIRDRDGAIIGASKILRDITDRLKAQKAQEQKALALREVEFRASFESAAVGQILAEPLTRTLIRVNQAFARMIGYQPDGLIGRRMTEFIAPDDQALDAAEYARLLGGETSAQVLELRLVRMDGAPIWVRASAGLAVSPDDGRPFLTTVAVEDIDVRRKAQMDLLESQRRLEMVVRERTAALAERDILLREVYHRVKNNLQVIEAMLVIGMQKVDDPRGQEVLNGLRTRIHALALVHHQLIGSSDLKTFDIAPFIRELCENIFESAAHDRIRLTVCANPLDVGLDFAVPLGLVVAELVTNALKHAFPGGVGDVSVFLRPEGRERVLLTVSDNGVGTSPDVRPGRERGFGSRMVTSLVSQLRGEITVEHGQGTTTHITLPLSEAP